jgi:hypothetical protein
VVLQRGFPMHNFDGTVTPESAPKRNWKQRFLSQGYDKVKTLSLCRFDLSSRHRIEKVRLLVNVGIF